MEDEEDASESSMDYDDRVDIKCFPCDSYIYDDATTNQSMIYAYSVIPFGSVDVKAFVDLDDPMYLNITYNWNNSFFLAETHFKGFIENKIFDTTSSIYKEFLKSAENRQGSFLRDVAPEGSIRLFLPEKADRNPLAIKKYVDCEKWVVHVLLETERKEMASRLTAVVEKIPWQKH
jgi:hypothetical protein